MPRRIDWCYSFTVKHLQRKIANRSILGEGRYNRKRYKKKFFPLFEGTSLLNKVQLSYFSLLWWYLLLNTKEYSENVFIYGAYVVIIEIITGTLKEVLPKTFFIFVFFDAGRQSASPGVLSRVSPFLFTVVYKSSKGFVALWVTITPTQCVKIVSYIIVYICSFRSDI